MGGLNAIYSHKALCATNPPEQSGGFLRFSREVSMARMPDSIRVGYRDYRVEDWPGNLATAEDRYGECDRMNGIIRVRADMGAQKTAETLVHELLHAAYSMGRLSDDDDEEKIVSVMANQLTQIWRDNPQFVAFMESTFRPD